MPPSRNLLCHVCGTIFQYRSQVDVHILLEHPRNSKPLQRLSSTTARDTRAVSPALVRHRLRHDRNGTAAQIAGQAHLSRRRQPRRLPAASSTPTSAPVSEEELENSDDSDASLDIHGHRQSDSPTASSARRGSPRPCRTAAVAAQVRMEQLNRTTRADSWQPGHTPPSVRKRKNVSPGASRKRVVRRCTAAQLGRSPHEDS